MVDQRLVILLVLVIGFIFFLGFIALTKCDKSSIPVWGGCCPDRNENLICDDNELAGQTMFDSAKGASLQVDCVPEGLVSHLTDEGVFRYFYDDFSSYAATQFVLSHFEKDGEWAPLDSAVELSVVDEYYGGSGALSCKASQGQGEISLEKMADGAYGLWRWNSSGYITMWLKTVDSSSIDSIWIELEDLSGKKRSYMEIPNVHPNSPNTFDNDIEYPDFQYYDEDGNGYEWTDFTVEDGWNFIFWRGDQYDETSGFDMGHVSKIRVGVSLNGNYSGEPVILDDLRISDGLQKKSNPANGVWHPPHGRPQYGVYDIDSADGGAYELRLLNVRNTQYPSNGDHARMVSSGSMPLNFAMSLRFRFERVYGTSKNGFFRVTYDFEPDWDPGHDWFGAYVSFEYEKFGLVTVEPIERKTLQRQEPEQGSNISMTWFKPREGANYRMDIVAIGQDAYAAIYEAEGSQYLKVADVNYTFIRPRYGEGRRYPLAIESTGNLITVIESVEIVSLGESSRLCG